MKIENIAFPAGGLIYGQTNRGFDKIEFLDRYEVPCSLQKSSLATEDAIWFGCNDASPRQLVPDKGWTPIEMPANYCADTRMHLTQDQVRALLPALEHFANAGDILCRTCGGEGAVGSPTNAEPCPECSYGSELTGAERDWFRRGYESAVDQPAKQRIAELELRLTTAESALSTTRKLLAAWERGEVPPRDATGIHYDQAWLDAAPEFNGSGVGVQPAGAPAASAPEFPDNSVTTQPPQQAGAQAALSLVDALKFYAAGSHFRLYDPSAWDTVNGEPCNFYEDESNTATVEDGSVAKMALTAAGVQ